MTHGDLDYVVNVNICNFAILGLDFHEIFTKMFSQGNGNIIHNFGKFLLIFELGRGRY